MDLLSDTRRSTPSPASVTAQQVLLTARRITLLTLPCTVVAVLISQVALCTGLAPLAVPAFLTAATAAATATVMLTARSRARARQINLVCLTPTAVLPTTFAPANTAAFAAFDDWASTQPVTV